MTAGLILAGGLSRRMGARNKLLEPWGGKPLVRHVAEAALHSALADVVCVLGHDATAVRRALPKALRSIVARDHEAGLSATLKAGLATTSGPVMVLLADMPLVTANHINDLLTAFDEQNPLVAASHEGRMGNPVLFDAAFRDALMGLDGDRGARSLLERQDVRLVDIGPAALCDFDTPEAFAKGG